MPRRLLPLVLAALFATCGPVAAQDFFRSLFGPPRYVVPPQAPPAPSPGTRTAVPAQPEEDPVRVERTPPAYEGEMTRLAEILGALHYLHPLCGAGDAQRWRGEMQRLIDAERPPPDRRDRMVASFNRAYGAYEQTYRGCTPAAELAIRRFIDEGARLSREIATRYGN